MVGTMYLASTPGADDFVRVGQEVKVGDVLCIIPPVAFQRGIGAVIEVSTDFDDPDLAWNHVWSWENRVWFATLVMFCVGSFEWIYLYRLSTLRPATTPLKEEEQSFARPVDSTSNFGVDAEKDRSRVDDDGVNARDLVKVFRTTPPGNQERRTIRRRQSPILKKAVKGVSFGIKKGEIFAALGPNGAGKVSHLFIRCSNHPSL